MPEGLSEATIAQALKAAFKDDSIKVSKASVAAATSLLT